MNKQDKLSDWGKFKRAVYFWFVLVLWQSIIEVANLPQLLGKSLSENNLNTF
jgi:hypothetical protein